MFQLPSSVLPHIGARGMVSIGTIEYTRTKSYKYYKNVLNFRDVLRVVYIVLLLRACSWTAKQLA
jgi:hypothetical protein